MGAWCPRYDPDHEGDGVNLALLTSSTGLRIYKKDDYDSRCRVGDDLLLYQRAKEAFLWMREHPGEPCQIPAWMGRNLMIA